MGRLAAMVLAIGLLLAACGGSAPHIVPGIASVTGTRDVVNGEARLTTTISVRFDRPLEFAPRRVPLESLFELEWTDSATATPKQVRQQIARATEDEDGRGVTLHISTLVPDGAELRVRRSAFVEGDEGTLAATVAGDVSPLAALLASRAFAITREEVVARDFIPAVTDADRDSAAMRAALEEHLARRQAEPATAARALSRYDAMPAATVPSPKARAALAALTGTFAESAIDYLLTESNCTRRPVAAILFQEPPEAPGLFARVTFAADGRRVVSLNPIIEGEPIERLMSILAHEAIHCDREAGILEEISATAFDAFLYLNMLAVFPELADDGTPLSRDLNVDVVAMINSGRRFPESAGVLPSFAIDQALPGSDSDAGSFAALVADAYGGLPAESPAEPLAQAYVTVLAAQGGIEEGPAFDPNYLDQLLGRAASPLAILGAIEALMLVPLAPG